MTDSASLKINRASEHVDELNKLFGKARPFSLTVKTDTKATQRILRPKNNDAIINKTALIVGDVVHNLRSALDHAYWEIVSPYCNSRELGAVQFPFSKKADTLDGAIQQRLAHYAGIGFYCGLRKLLPHGEPGGNDLLYLIHEMDILDKHKLLIPTGDQISGEMLMRSVPSFPFRLGGAGALFSSCVFSWKYVGPISPAELGAIQIPSLYIFERELDIPVDVVFRIGALGKPRPVVPTLNALIDTARKTIALIRESAESY